MNRILRSTALLAASSLLSTAPAAAHVGLSPEEANKGATVVLGFGIGPTAAAEWGYDLNRALSDTASGIWWTGVFPGAAIVLMVLGITLMGESLNDLADPRLRTRRRAKRKTKAGRGAEQAPTTTNDEVTA